MTRHVYLGAGAVLFRLLGGMIARWQLVLVIAYCVSPIGPHVRWEYTYRDMYGQRAYLACTYLGSRGFVTPDLAPDCPLFAFLDARDWRR